MSEVHELTLREYYESFAQSLDEDPDETEVMIEHHLEPEIIYLGDDIIEESEVIEILESDSEHEYTPEIISESPKKSIQRLKVEHPKLDPLMLGKSKSLKAIRRNEDDSMPSRRVTRSSKQL